MTYKLINPCINHQSSYLTYIQELGKEERYPFPLDFDHTDFPVMLEKIQQLENGVNLPQGYVPSSTYWLVEKQEIIGVSNLRHHLNNQLEYVGGHIGLSIRPSRRGEKLSVLLLRLTLEKAIEKGIKALQIHCYAYNSASAKMIVACGGELHSEEAVGDKVVQRYVIDTKQSKN